MSRTTLVRRWLAAEPGPSLAEIEADVAAEFEHHLALLREDELARGGTPEQANANARRRFGDAGRHKRACIRISTGSRTMKFKVSVMFNILLALALAWALVGLYATTKGWNEATRDAIAFQNSPPAVQEALRKQSWRSAAGMVRVEGLVRAPGDYFTSLDAPLSLRQALAMAGGPADGARGVGIASPSFYGGETWQDVKNAMLGPGRNQIETELEPGTVVTVR